MSPRFPFPRSVLLFLLLCPAISYGHAVVDVGVTIHAPQFVPRSGAFVMTTEITDYAYDPALAIVVQYKFPPGLVMKSASGAGWSCSTFNGVPTCSAETLSSGVSTIELHMVAPSVPGAIRIEATQLSIANFDPYQPNDTAAATVEIFDPSSCAGVAPVITAPGEMAVLSGGQAALQWTAVPGASRYRVWTAVEGASPFIAAETTEPSLPADLEVGTIEWWVEAAFDHCPSTSSAHSLLQSNGAPAQWTVSDFAGRAGVRGIQDGSAAQATFDTPSSLGADIYGEVFVLDSDASTLRRIDAQGQVHTVAGAAETPGWSDGTESVSLMNHPRALVVTAGGYAYIADTGNNVIRQLFPNGNGIFFTTYLATLAGSPASAGSRDGVGTAASFSAPSGIAATSDYTLVVTDAGSNRVRRITSAGAVTSLTSSSDPGWADGSALQARFNGPAGVAIDGAGEVFVADTENHVVRRIDRDGMVTTVAGKPGTPGFSDGRGNHAQFDHPTGLAVDALGNLYVADTGNHAIRRVAPSGLVTTMIGSGSAGHQNGPGATATLSAPTGIAFDFSGHLLVADGGNRMIRQATVAAQPHVVTPSSRRRSAHH